jgi:hypothetical protein
MKLCNRWNRKDRNARKQKSECEDLTACGSSDQFASVFRRGLSEQLEKGQRRIEDEEF